MRIISENAKVTSVGPAVEAIDVEIRVEEYEGDDYIQDRYVNLHALDGLCFFVTEESVVDMSDNTEQDCIEKYDSLSESEGSKYYKVFSIANRMYEELNSMEI